MHTHNVHFVLLLFYLFLVSKLENQALFFSGRMYEFSFFILHVFSQVNFLEQVQVRGNP